MKRLDLSIKCVICRKYHNITVDQDGYEKWLSGSYIQDVMPYLLADERELLISKICGNCFDDIFKE